MYRYFLACIIYIYLGDGPFPGVIDMFGVVGGIVEFRAALLASRGFAALALPYFNYEDLPQAKGLYVNLELEYFEVTNYYERNVKNAGKVRCIYYFT